MYGGACTHHIAELIIFTWNWQLCRSISSRNHVSVTKGIFVLDIFPMKVKEVYTTCWMLMGCYTSIVAMFSTYIKKDFQLITFTYCLDICIHSSVSNIDVNFQKRSRLDHLSKFCLRFISFFLIIGLFFIPRQTNRFISDPFLRNKFINYHI